MKEKYKLKTNDTLKCSACGNKEFEEKHMVKDGMECWVYICSDCGHVMGFMTKLEKK